MVPAMFDEIKISITAVSCLMAISCAPILEKQTQDDQRSVTKLQGNRADQISWASHCKKWDEWDKAGPAYKIYGNSYYVGTCGISAILITGDNGHILIDGATETGADIILSNIRTLGFNPKDIKTILHSHEHHDHVGGFAKLQAATGANIIASKAARYTLETGKISTKDPQFGTHDDMQPVNVSSIIAHEHVITTDARKIIAIETPGHSPGALSWAWQECENGQCLSLVYADSLSPISNDTYKFSDHPNYVKNYHKGLAYLSQLQCDILLTPHPSASHMIDRIKQDKNLLNNSDCTQYTEALSTRLNKRIQEEKNRK